jgi:predicted GNAT family N-acyltransferase
MNARHHAEFDERARIARMPMDVEVFPVTDRERMDAALAVRFPVFVDEQRVPAEEEVDAHDRDDPHARHVLVRDGATAVAAGRYYRIDAVTVQIGRMAVLAEARGRGVGRLMLDALLADARERGYARASLNAQVHALAFYEKAGFRAYGPTFEECAIVHQAMDRAL